MKAALSVAVAAASIPLARAAGYNLLQNWQGNNFFDNWVFYGAADNLTNGDAVFANQSVAFAEPQLAFINSANNAIVRVDNTTNVPFNQKRNTIRLQSTESYGLGSLWVMDALHLPYGCSVWPAFWSQATKWPEGGEIDTLENVNLAVTNQMALHTEDGCQVLPASSSLFTGDLTDGDCGTELPAKTQGCTVTDSNDASYGAAFAAGGGGVYATLLADSGVYIWFFPRASIPSDLSVSNANSSPNPDGWPKPSAFYPSTGCPTSTFFEPQFIILDITLCGDFAGALNVYNETCGPNGPGTVPSDAPTNYCYTSNVMGDGSNYANAYFEVQYIRVWSNTTTANSTTGGSSGSGGNSSSSGSGGSSGKSSAVPVLAQGAAAAALLGLLGAVALLV